MLVVVVVGVVRRVAVSWPSGCPITALIPVSSAESAHLRAAATSAGCTIWPVVFDQWFLV